MKMQTLFVKRSKTMLQMILSLVLVITAIYSGNAQTTKTFTIPGKNILVSYNELPAGQAGLVTFTLTNKTGTALASATKFALEFPTQAGLNYDVSSIKSETGTSFTGIPFCLTIIKDFENESTLFFTCKMMVGNPVQGKVGIFILKQ